MVFWEYAAVYCFGSIGYGLLELAWRGFTHWTMPLTGGFCACLVYLISTRMGQPLWKTWILCAACITSVEFAVGCAVNLKMGWDVWDYSGLPLNFMGQICPLFSFFWFLLSMPCTVLSRLVKRRFFPKP